MRRPFRSWRVVAVLALSGLGGSGLAGCGALLGPFESPKAAFSPDTAPPAPDYSQAGAWMAYPGRNGLERQTLAGDVAVNEATAPADVFFIHPTTYKRNDVWNVAYDAPGEFDSAVLLGQASVFNGCCRIFAPQYRQASIRALDNSQDAVDLAYSDVAAAFRYYIAHENHDRPFIIAAHSQGAMHAVRLLQAEVLGTSLQSKLVAAYVIGAYVPSDFGQIGLPICDRASQTQCILSWNTSQKGRKGAYQLIRDKPHWWQGQIRRNGPTAVCVNPLTWNQTDTAPASSNPGSLPFPKDPKKGEAPTLPALVPHLTGAECHDGLLQADIPLSAPAGFQDILSVVFGSYHLGDYGIFYPAIRQNVAQRINGWSSIPRSGYESVDQSDRPIQ